MNTLKSLKQFTFMDYMGVILKESIQRKATGNTSSTC